MNNILPRCYNIIYIIAKLVLVIEISFELSFSFFLTFIAFYILIIGNDIIQLKSLKKWHNGEISLLYKILHGLTNFIFGLQIYMMY